MNEPTKSNSIKTILIVVLALIAVGSIGYITYDKLIKKEETKTEEKLTQLNGKIRLKDYCSSNSCKKDIGYINFNGKNLKFSVDLDNLNATAISGKIVLGDNQLDVSKLNISLYELEGFEIYNDNLLVYMNGRDFTGDCKLVGYEVLIFDKNLNKLSGVSGYTKMNAFDDFKIEDGYLYYYGTGTTKMINDSTRRHYLTYYKIKFDYLLNKEQNKEEVINYSDTYYLEEEIY